MLTLLLVLLLRLVRLVRLASRGGASSYRRVGEPTRAAYRHRRKPEWVRQQVIRLKALLAEAGSCRSISDTFNRLFGRKRGMTVGKTFVSDVIREARYEIEVLRREIKNAKPKCVPKNLVWGIDLTGKTTLDGTTQVILGVLEHASRAALLLEALPTKSSWMLIRKLAEAIKRYGKAHIVRTDNEAVFTSWAFRLALLMLGIRHQRIDPGCPWQNGRVERLFGTLKERLDRLAVESLQGLTLAFGEFRFFYNQVRTHRNLSGQTPAEAWAEVDPLADSAQNEYWFEAWDGLLRGYYLRR